MSNIEPIPLEDQLLAPPIALPLGVRGGGSMVGADRDIPGSNGFIRLHAGIDLFCQRPTSNELAVWAVSTGTVEQVIRFDDTDWEIQIRHHPHISGVYSLYRHLCQEPYVNAGDEVDQGQKIGAFDPNAPRRDDGRVLDHLHFGWVRLMDPNETLTIGSGIPNYICMNPTRLLYRFEVYKWNWHPADPNGTTAYLHGEDYPYSKINRIRVIPFPEGNLRAATWLLQVDMPDRIDQKKDEAFFLPINNALSHEKLLIDIIRDAFNHGKRVKLGWRDSYFYVRKAAPPRRMIDDIRVRP
jgi:hypothetical protein